MKAWLEQNSQNKRLLAEESFILDATEAIWSAMGKNKWSKADLAKHAGCSRPYISQVLSGSRNMTLRTFAQLAHALGVSPAIEVRESATPLDCDQWTDLATAIACNVTKILPRQKPAAALQFLWDSGNDVSSDHADDQAKAA